MKNIHSLSILNSSFRFALLLFLFLIIKQPMVYSQNSTAASNQRDSLLQVRNELLDKSQSQKTWAWVTMGAGIPVTVLGIGRAVLGPEDMLLIGMGMIVGSIVLFSKANKNQTKALKMDLGFIFPLSPSGHSQLADQRRQTSLLLTKMKAMPGIRFTFSF